ncbi:MAG: spore cortex biosynthesis protein YabQ [Eubacteriales bacterium]|jgi:spore cortex biosynthesis protein YabQ|nr:hypothetical protein [Clostridiales bacterium]
MGIVTYIEHTELAALFLYAAALGCAFGILYDVFRVLRRASQVADRSFVSVVIIFFQDILFFLIVTAASAIFFYKFNSGRIRLSAIAFMLCGFAAYYFTIGRLVMLVADTVIAFVRRLIRQVVRFLGLLLSPLAKIVKAACSRLKHAARHLLLHAYTKRTLLRYNKLLYK